LADDGVEAVNEHRWKERPSKFVKAGNPGQE